MGDNNDSVPQVNDCPTCLLIRVRDTSQVVWRNWDESPSNDPEPVESELASYSRPFQRNGANYPTLSYQAALRFFHGDSPRNLYGNNSICSLCDHWLNGLFTREWKRDEYIARISLGTFKEIEARSNCRVCRLVEQIISRSAFELDDTRPLALELVRTSYCRSCPYLCAATILYKDLDEFQFSGDLDKLGCPRFTLFDDIAIKPDFAKPEVNWDRLRLWYTERLSCLVETDGIQVPKYAALSYVWGKSDEEIITTKENFESLKVQGRFRERDVPLLFQDAFEVCSQLGIDHFWIDRICVVQDDESRKSAQLETMGRIYSTASLTIVSSEPSFISKGLPGVSQPRATPVYLCAGDKVVVPETHGGRLSSTWETRGWTYQEGLLSQNVLIFNEDTVYMYSRSSKGVDTEAFREPEIRKDDYISASLVPEDQQYSDQVKEYSKRLLTFGSDKINAFMGVLNNFGEHQYGLPNTIIDQAMLWHYTYQPSHSGPKFPGHEFPSWSWASTVGPIEYRHLPSEHRPLFSVATYAILQADQSDQPMVKVLDDLQPGQQSESQKHLATVRGHILPLEARPTYDPVAVAMASNLSERYRLIQGSFGDYIYGDTSMSGTTAGVNSLAEFSRWKKFVLYLKHFFGILGSRDQAILQLLMRARPFKKAPWFQGLGRSLSQVPQEARVDTLLRLAKPSSPNLLERLSTVELEAALQPGRIVVHAPKMAVQLKYTQRCFKGTHIWMIGYGGKLIGIAELSDPRHKELLGFFSRDPTQDKVEVYCIALSLMACRVEYTEKGRQDYSSTQESHSTVFTMIASPPLMNCSHRLGLGFIDYPKWSSLGDVPIETTILG
ncbi:hypothetical protein LB507_004269 [Fusarium sp. FIESC RH6]|nr:hypothetical protein LB507_004269 [Fusarium sp. FIESC RH6]